MTSIDNVTLKICNQYKQLKKNKSKDWKHDSSYQIHESANNTKYKIKKPKGRILFAQGQSGIALFAITTISSLNIHFLACNILYNMSVFRKKSFLCCKCRRNIVLY